jgi:hypothetical protein
MTPTGDVDAPHDWPHHDMQRRPHQIVETLMVKGKETTDHERNKPDPQVDHGGKLSKKIVP